MDRGRSFTFLVVGLLCGSGCGRAAAPEAAAPEAAAPSSPHVPPELLSLGDPRLDQSTCPGLSVNPPYPEIARQGGVEGTVIVRAVVEPDGTLSHITLVKSAPPFDDAAVASVALSRVRPFTA